MFSSGEAANEPVHEPDDKDIGILSPDFELVKLLVADVERHVLHDEQDHRSEEIKPVLKRHGDVWCR